MLLAATTYGQDAPPTVPTRSTVIRGTVLDKKHQPVPGANVYLATVFDGASSDTSGRFMFRSSQVGSQTLVTSSVGYTQVEKPVSLAGDTLTLTITLPDVVNTLSMVTISAGSFDASDEKRMVMLKPLDIVTTAGAAADITSALQMLPGTQRVGEQEGLFVRGGSASETTTLIDGMMVQNPFYSSIPDIAQRGRFTPGMFKGTSFSTGGYSAQYGQALSSVLLLETQDKRSSENKWMIDLNPANAAVSYTHQGSIVGRISYTNMGPYFKLLRQNVNWVQSPEGLDGSLEVREKVGKHGTLKLYGLASGSSSATNLPTFQKPDDIYLFQLRNKNYFTTNSYQHMLGDGKWMIKAGFSYNYNYDYINVADAKTLDRYDRRVQYRTVLTRFLKGNNSIMIGGEVHYVNVMNELITKTFSLEDTYTAGFAEGEFYIGTKLAVRAGLRAEHSKAIGRSNLAPRLSMSYQVGAHGQVSLAAGQFYQTPDKGYLYRNQNLNFEEATHLILNYQYMHNDRTFRVEAYHKQYDQLVRETNLPGYDPDPYRPMSATTNNSGYGYARGIDVFFRDKTSIKYGDFWVAYSLLDTRRLAGNFLASAMPTYASTHNLSFVYKHYLSKPGLSLGATYRIASGRPFYAHESSEFLGDRLPTYQNLSVSISKLFFFKRNYVVLYTTIDNVLGSRNVFGYRYSPDGASRYEVRPPAYRTVFVGISMNLTK
ncbi:TonB-dependent receptor [Spirosoma daeguense]